MDTYLHWSEIPKSIPLFFIILGLFLTKYFIIYIYKKRAGINKIDNFIIGINSIFYVILSVLLAIFILLLLKVNIKQFFTSISIIAASIAIVSKDYISNSINGMILMFNNQISIGDVVKIGEHKGKIDNITLINVQLLNEDNDLVYIANNFVLMNDVVNYSRKNNHKTNLVFKIKNEKVIDINHLENYFKNNLPSLIVKNQSEYFLLKVLEIHDEHTTIRAEVKFNQIDRGIDFDFKKEVFHFLQLYQK